MSKQELRIDIHIHFDYVNFRLGDDIYTQFIYDQIEYQIKGRDILTSCVFRREYSKENKLTINGRLYKPIDDIILSYYPDRDDTPLFPFFGYISCGMDTHNIRTTLELTVKGEKDSYYILDEFLKPFIGLHELDNDKIQTIYDINGSNKLTIIFTEFSNLKPIILFG